MNPIEEFGAITKKLKSIEFLGFKGYQVDKILTIPTQEVLKDVFKLGFIRCCRILLGNIIKERYHYSFSSIKNAKVVLYYSHDHAQRNDYVRFMEMVASCSKDTVLFTGLQNRRRTLSNFKIDFSSIKMVFLLFSWMLTLSRNGIKRKYWAKFLASLLDSYKWKLMLIENQETLLSIQSLVTIFDAREYENVLTQFVSHYGIPTATLQHGHYGHEYYHDPKHFYIGIGYRGFVSDFFLAWGESSYHNAINCGINKSKVIKVGAPSLINSKVIKGTKGAIGLLLDGGEEAIPDNKNMYNIVREVAKEKRKKLLVKLHPSYRTPDYSFFVGDDNVELYNGDLESFAADIELAICCNTSCLLLLLSWRIHLIHYAPIFMYDMYGELRNYSFSNTKELIDLYENELLPSSLLSLYTEVNHVKENYKKVFEQIVTSNIK